MNAIGASGAFLVMLSAALVAACCIYLSLHPFYKSGVFGSIGLGLLGLGAASRFFNLAEHCLRESCDLAWISPEGLFTWVGLAFFFAQCVYRFNKRVRSRRAGGPWYA